MVCENKSFERLSSRLDTSVKELNIKFDQQQQTLLELKKQVSQLRTEVERIRGGSKDAQ